ncbi:MAG TPA: DUF3634 family protein [Isosphaeraceae bacterium]|nr:DUF3634 family protein [Isosphaeraceae bacterium]
MQLFVSLALAAFVVWVIWSICGPQCTFVVRIRDGVPGLTRGKVSQAFLQEIAEVCARHGVREGVVRGIKKADRIGLSFSDGLPAPCQQQLRNLWHLSARMSPPPTRRRRP